MEGWTTFIPSCVAGGAATLPLRYASTLQWRGKAKRSRPSFSKGSFVPQSERAFYARALTDKLGLRHSVSTVLSRRPKAEIRRIEEELKGIIDCLILSQHEVFEDKKSVKLIKSVLRKVIAVGLTDLDQVTKWWKEITSFVITKSSKAIVRSTTLKLSNENVFKRFLFLPRISLWVTEGIKGHGEAERLAHFMSTRQLVAGGKATEKKALIKFRDLTSTKFEVSDSDLSQARRAGELIGRKIRKLCTISQLDLSSHISLANAGSFATTVKDGGRSKDIRDAIAETLKIVPIVDETIQTPFGELKCLAGYARWRCWCRTTPVESLEGFTGANGIVTNDSFGSPHPGVLLMEEDRLWGYDEVIGLQILQCAFLEGRMLGYIDDDGTIISPIPARSLTVPEPGGKARVVTTTMWWVIILEQGLGHMLQSFLSVHPSATSGLTKADQAWQFLSLAQKVKKMPLGSFCLSSDLEEATDAIPPEVARQLLEGFLGALKIGGLQAQLAVNLVCSERLVGLSTSPEEVFLKLRGVLMGEPLTKAVLTILNLGCEELAIREYLKLSDHEPVIVPWRCYAVAGDDHVALGPRKYLEGITRFHVAFGSKISKDKHRMSRHFVVMCEKILLVQPLLKGFDLRAINDSVAGYEAGPFVDSVKVRLLSPCSKSFDIKNDRNIAIGKAISLGKTLRWLNRTYFPTTWIKMVRERFLSRMGAQLPSAGESLYYQLLLPRDLGGLDLWIDEDLPYLPSRLPLPTRQVLKGLSKGEDVEKDLKILSGFPSNSSYRGYSESSTRDAIAVQIEQIGLPKEPIWKMVNELIPHLKEAGPAIQTRELSRLGWFTMDNIEDFAMRGLLFRDIIRGVAVASSYNTEPWKRRYAKIWDAIYKENGDAEISEADLKGTFKKAKRFNVYFVHARTVVDYTRPDGTRVKIDESLLEELSNALPILRIGAGVIAQWI